MEGRKRTLKEMKMCRFCLASNDKELSNIYQREAKTIPLPVMIMSCASIEVFPNDGLPQMICNSCKQQTNQAYIFRSNCKKADDALRNYLQTGELIQPNIKKPPAQNTAKRPPSPVPPIKDVKVVASNQSSSKQSPEVKRMKMNDGTEIITLFISDSDNVQSQDESSQESTVQETEVIVSQEQDESDNGEEPLEVPKQVDTDIFPCNCCDRTFPLKQLLDLHISNYHRERQFACAQCDSKFFTKYDLMKHQTTHSSQKPFTCSICERDFSREALLRRHEQTHVEAPKYACMQCDKTFLVKENMEIHMKKHEKKRPFTCDVCNKSFVFKQGLERHMTSVHAEDRPYKCNYCDCSFNTPIRLTRHITQHAGLRPYPCKICGRTFLLSHHLTRHLRSHYAAEQGQQPEQAIGPYKCDVCSMAFKRKDSLINHSAIHSMVNLRCVICNTAFENAKLVKEHITTHLQGLSYPCDKCDYSFETSDQLEEHQLKHAEMEYEEQIEKEVISEVNQIRNQLTEESEAETSQHADESELYHIDDVNEALVSKISTNTSELDTFKASAKQTKTSDDLIQFFKTELSDTEGEYQETAHVTGEDEGQYAAEEENSIKPIFRVEGTKVYERKGPIKRKIPKVETNPQNVGTVPLEQINEPLNMGAITQETLNNLPTKKVVNVKVGDKVVKVQKYIISKEEMKQMAKMGILEVKNGQVIMKNPGQPVLNAVIKPVQQSDIESLLTSQKHAKTTVKQYERKGHSSQSFSEHTVENIIEDFD